MSFLDGSEQTQKRSAVSQTTHFLFQGLNQLLDTSAVQTNWSNQQIRSSVLTDSCRPGLVPAEETTDSRTVDVFALLDV